MIAVDKDGKMIDDDELQMEVLMNMGGLPEHKARIALAFAKGETEGDVVNEPFEDEEEGQ